MTTVDAGSRPARRASPLGGAISRRLLAETRLTRRELAITALALALLAAVTFQSHIRLGGFHADDWGVLLLVKFPPHPGSGLIHAIQSVWPYYGRRPGEAVWYAIVDLSFGYDASAQLALAAAMLVAAVVAIFALLRTVGMATLHAAAIAALILVFPFSDSLWLWAIQSMATLTIVLYVGGLLLALRAFSSSGRRAVALHAASIALYVIALLSYEWFAVIACIAGLLYVQRAGWRRAWPRWLLDLVAIVAALAVGRFALHDLVTPYKPQPLSGTLHHAGAIATAGAQIIASAAVPFGSLDYRIVLAALAALVAIAALRRALSAGTDPVRATLGHWLVVAGIGLLIAAAAWAIFVPGISSYSPSATGTGNRVNGLAGIGVVIFLYASAMLLGTLLTSARRTGSSATVVALAFVAFAGTGYLQHAHADAQVWNRAASVQRRLLSSLHRLVPRPPPRSRFYAYDFRTGVIATVPVFDYPWEFSSAIKSSYSNGSLGGVVVGARTQWKCRRNLASAYNGGYSSAVGADYGRAYLIDIDRQRATTLLGAAQCRQVTLGLR